MAELILSIGFFAVAILAILALSVSIARTDSKAVETSAGTLVADRLLQRTLASIYADQPAGARDTFWAIDHVSPPWEEGTIQTNGNQFQYVIYATTVNDSAGTEIGSLAEDNLLKKVDIRVWWWGQQRTGYGRLEVRNSRLVSEAELE
ncbi:MAG: hypothetical protein HY319_14980 [Armatimonadetes bacterium]|nr:hypothetical protein [Armatimonadota bacterium]